MGNTVGMTVFSLPTRYHINAVTKITVILRIVKMSLFAKLLLKYGFGKRLGSNFILAVSLWLRLKKPVPWKLIPLEVSK